MLALILFSAFLFFITWLNHGTLLLVDWSINCPSHLFFILASTTFLFFPYMMVRNGLVWYSHHVSFTLSFFSYQFLTYYFYVLLRPLCLAFTFVEANEVALNLLVDDTDKLKKVMSKLARKIRQQKAVISRYKELDWRLGF